LHIVVGSFVQGITAYGRALEFINRHKLWSYVLVPMLISLVLGLLVLSTAWAYSDDLGQWIMEKYPWQRGRSALESASSFLGGLIFVVFGLLVFRHVVMALSAPVMSPLSEKIEEIVTGRHGQVSFSVQKAIGDLVRGIRISLRNVLRELVLTLLLSLFGLIPVFSIFSAAGIFLIQSYYAGFGNIDFTLERHYGVRDAVRFVRRHAGLAIGNGVVFMLLLFTGIGFVLALPLGTVAATLETVRRLDGEN
jgi:CysZ protein